MNPQDPLDEAIGLLKARSQGRAPTNPDLDALVMRSPMKATSATKSIFVKAILAVLACAAIGCGVVIAAGGVQQISEYFGFRVTVEFTKPDGENVTVEGILDGNQLLDEGGQVIPELSDVRVERIEGTDVFITRGRKEDVEKVTSIEGLAGGNQEGNVVNEDGEAARARSSSLEIPATREAVRVMHALIKLNAATAKELEPGRHVDVQVDAFPNRRFTGTLTAIVNERDSGDNAFGWILVDDTKGITLRAGMTAVVTIELEPSGESAEVESHDQASTFPDDSLFVGPVQLEKSGDVMLIRGARPDLDRIRRMIAEHGARSRRGPASIEARTKPTRSPVVQVERKDEGQLIITGESEQVVEAVERSLQGIKKD